MSASSLYYSVYDMIETALASRQRYAQSFFNFAIYSHRHALEHVCAITSLQCSFCTFTPYPSFANSFSGNIFFSFHLETSHLCGLTLFALSHFTR